MRPVLPLIALAALVALPAAAAGHHHGAKSHGGRSGSSAAGSATPSALNTPYDYGTGDPSAKAGVATTAMSTTMMATTTDGAKAAKAAKAGKAGKDDFSAYNLPATGASRKHGKAQALPAY